MLPVLIFPGFDPVLVAIGPLQIRWYALAYIGSLLLGWRIVRRLVQLDPPVATPELADDFLTWATLGVVLGGRLGYVLFYQPLHYLQHPLDALMVWQGGMSFHGGALGVITALILYCRRHALPLLGFADRIVTVVPIGLGFGRIANFINGELWGREAPASLPWAMIFPYAGPEPRHPSQLYQAGMEGLLLGLLLAILCARPAIRARYGLLCGVFLAGYAIARIIGEHFREPDAFLGFLYGGITMGQLLSIPMLLLGLALILRARLTAPGTRLIEMERLDHFMARANAAYYATHDPFKDFTTSPEITQVFGELLGLWSAVTWDLLGRPGPVLLVECGPGRGTLMQDALRATATVAPAFHAALRLHLIETSPRLRVQQAARLPAATWHDTLATLPPGPMILLANEFLDALPIRQFVRRGASWTERFVESGAFVERPAPGPDCPAADGEIVEQSDISTAFITNLAARLARPEDGGAALFLDYGPARSAPGDSLQALQDGHPASPLEDPGSRDLTAHVDFQALASAATPCDVHGPIQQGPFLARLGLFQRTGILARTQPAPRAALLIHAAQRLAEPDRMGGLFKVLSLCQPGLPTPPGFEP